MEFPSPPESVVQLRLLEERWQEFAGWAHNAMGDVYLARTIANLEAMTIEEYSRRSKRMILNQKRFQLRLAEIEATENAFRTAYDAVKSQLNFDEILAYAVLIEPIVRKRDDDAARLKRIERLRKVAGRISED